VVDWRNLLESEDARKELRLYYRGFAPWKKFTNAIGEFDSGRS
jgi:hypothetical protein